MNARIAYKVSVTKGAPGPALFAVPGRIDRVELVELASGETVLLWEGEPMEASRLTRALRRDLAKLNPNQFREAWLTEATIASGNV